MNHPVKEVAENRRLDPKKLAEFAEKNHLRYSIIPTSAGPTVSTWHVDQFVEDFKKENDLSK